MVYVDWDGGSKLSMCLDAGDEIRTIQSVTMIDSAADAALDDFPERIAQAGDAAASPLHPHVTADTAALLGRLDRTGLGADDLTSLAWIVDRANRGAPLERLEGNLSSVGRIVGAVVREGATVSHLPSVQVTYLQVQLEPTGDRVLWPLDELIAAQPHECLFELT